ncbi:MAG: hypothetical protein HOP29_18720, partial [Phycisphaerales bacterium]|nr:hypothetical protein [Phycisphaerales bacterium]
MPTKRLLTDDDAPDAVTLRVRVESFDGVFVVYDRPIVDGAPQPMDGDAAPMGGAEAGGMEAVDADSPAYLAYWRGYDLPHLYVFDRLLRDPIDMGHALRALERDLNVNVKQWADAHDVTRSAWDAADDAVVDSPAAIDAPDHSGRRARRNITRAHWQPVTADLLKSTIRDTPEIDAPPLRQFPMPAVDCDCDPDPWIPLGKVRLLPKPPHGLTVDDTLRAVVTTTGCCCPGSGGCCGMNCSDGNPCTTDGCSGGACTHTAASGACNDGNACTVGDYCQGGLCRSGGPRNCTDADPCTVDACLPTTGCQHATINCDDSNPCTQDSCGPGGVCVHVLISCDDLDACTDDNCHLILGCVNSPVVCEDGDFCTDDTCDPASGCLQEPTDCDDGFPCTNDVCDPLRGCAHVDACDDVNSCTEDSCEPVSGACMHAPITCDDGDSCTLNDRCTAGVCDSDPNPLCAWEPCPAGAVVDGHGVPEGEPYTIKKRIIIPQGTACLRVRVTYFSREWTYWTGQGSIYNDLINYGVTSPNGVISTGYTTVNPLHDQFTSGAFPGGNLLVFDQLVDVGSQTLDADSWIDVRGSTTNIADDKLGSGVAIEVSCVVVDLQLSNLPDDQELDPGGFLCVNNDDDDNNETPDKDQPGPVPGENDLRELTLTADGSLEGTLTLSVVSGTGKIRLYEGADRSNPVTPPLSWELLGLQKTFAVTLFVEGNDASAAVRDVELLLQFDGVTGDSCQDRVKATAVKVELLALQFDSDHGEMLDNNTDFNPTGTLFAQPEWGPIATPPRNNPISHTMGLGVDVIVFLSVMPQDMPAESYALVGTSTTPGFSFGTVLSLGGGLNIESVTSTGVLEPKIQTIEPMIEWRVAGPVCDIVIATSGPHTVYVTIGTPRDALIPEHTVTQKRMERAVEWAGASGSTKPHEIVKDVMHSLAPLFNLGPIPKTGRAPIYSSGHEGPERQVQGCTGREWRSAGVVRMR